MTLKDSIKADASSVFLQTSEFAEVVTYLPRKGGSRSIRAIVDRSPPAAFGPSGDVILIAYSLIVKNCGKNGIAHSEVDAGDEISLTAEYGDSLPKIATVMVVQESDFGMLTIGCK